MNGIREWAIILCSVSIGSAFIVFLIPDGSMKKSVNFVVSLFLFSVVILPVCGKESLDIELPEISIDEFPDEEDYMLEYSQFLMQSSENIVEKQILKILNELCKSDFSVNVSMKSDSNGDFVLSEIQITVSQEDSNLIETIKSQVKNLSGMIPQVVIDY